MVRDEYSGYCDQVSFVLVQLALENGIRARHVGLEGHVVMEAWYDNDWHMHDPDMKIVPAGPDDTILSVDALSRSDTLLEKYYSGTGFVDIIKSRENNNFVSTPAGSRFDWLNSLWVLVEKGCDILKFCLPAAMLIMALVHLNNHPKRSYRRSR